MSQTREYKVVRSYERGDSFSALQKEFECGWQFERASEYIPPRTGKSDRYVTTEYFGYIEYILSRDIKTE